jgi:single-stranded-DNA-specific exonuclease
MAGEAQGVLGVEQSFAGKRWRARLADERAGLAFAQRLGVPEIVGRIVAARGVALDDGEAWLNPTIRHYLPDPSRVADMDKAADRLARAVSDGESVAVFGDYDVDGATSSALLQRYFEAAGAPLRIYIPDRIAEGYGPNGPALRRLKEEGISLVVTVDCGITAHQALEEAASAGLEVIVVDHHAAEPRLPIAHAVVNPNRLDDTSSLGHLAAVGVAFLLVVALNRRLREAGWYRDSGRAEPDLMQWLDLVALGTVCDSVPLLGLNRAFVARGLAVMARRGNPGLAALADVAGMREAPGTYHAGFLLGPRVNAGGRVGESDLGARLLTARDAGGALALAERLDAHNRERQTIEAAVKDAAFAEAEREADDGVHCIVVAGQGWHPGVVGIVASRLVERFNRPACVVSFADGMGKGSGRSIAGVDLGSAIIAARQAGLLTSGGGHKMAAGFSVSADQLAALRAFLSERLAAEVALVGAVPSLGIDGALTVPAASAELAATIATVGPFGMGNAEPRFAFADARVAKADIVGKGHVRCFLSDMGGGGRLKGIAFRSAESELGQALLNARGGPLHLAGHLRVDTWQGRNGAQLIIEDGAPARPNTAGAAL